METTLPLILAHGPQTLGEILVFILLALLIPALFVVGVLLPPLLLLQPNMFRPAGLPPLPPDERRRQRRRIIAGIIINIVTLHIWSSLFIQDSMYSDYLMVKVISAFLGTEALIFLLRWCYCRYRATHPAP